MVVNGVIDLLLAGMILSGLPSAFAWALGLLVGIDLLFAGGCLIVDGLGLRRPGALIATGWAKTGARSASEP